MTVIEKEARVAAHQTGHNSGVVHAGVYYAPGSFKARLCAIGRERTREFCEQKNLRYRELGKLVVAISEQEIGRLDALEKRAIANSVPGLRRLGAAELVEIEPYSAGLAALHSSKTAVVDYAAITEVMADEVRESGGTILLGEDATAIKGRSRGVPLCGLSSSKSMFGFVKRSVAEHCVEDVASASGEGYEGLVVAFALGDLAVVVGSRDWVAQRRES